MKPRTYYVMHCIDGDEVLIAHCATYADAEARLRSERRANATADVSVWSSDGGLIALLDPSGHVVPGPAGRFPAVRRAR